MAATAPTLQHQQPAAAAAATTAAAAAAAAAVPPPPKQTYPRGHNPGLRYVEPYYYSYKTYAKGRWLGRELLEVVSTEFRDRSVEYYRHALEAGVTTLNGAIATPTTIIQSGDALQNTVHRHEPPISAHPVQVIFEDPHGQFIVIDKPGGMPVHPTGRYTKNTVTEVLMSPEFGYGKVHTVNRLDRLTSGLMFIALNPKTATDIQVEFKAGTIRKEYLARVRGCFPEEEVVVDQPLLTVDRQSGLVVVTPDGKPSKTIFNRLFYDGARDESVVRCRPITGRTHQIRVHLQFLGHPIPNDPIYGAEDVWSGCRTQAKGGIDLTPEEDGAEAFTPDYAPDQQVDPAAASAATAATAATAAAAADADAAAEDAREVAEGRATVARRLAAAASAGGAGAGAGEADPVPARGVRKLLPRETGADVGSSSPIKLSKEAREVIRRLRRMKDEQEDWARWKDVVLYTSAASRSPAIVQSLSAHLAADPAQPQNRFSARDFTQAPNARRASNASSASAKEAAALAAAEPAAPEQPKEEEEQEQQASTTPAPAPFAPPEGFCPVCYIPLSPDPDPDRLFIYLHARRYKTALGEFQTGLPIWARPDWDGSNGWADRARGQGRGGQVGHAAGAAGPAEDAGAEAGGLRRADGSVTVGGMPGSPVAAKRELAAGQA